MDVPGKSGILSPELYEREKEKFHTLMEETRELATVALRESLQGLSGIWSRGCQEKKTANPKSSRIQ